MSSTAELRAECETFGIDCDGLSKQEMLDKLSELAQPSGSRSPRSRSPSKSPKRKSKSKSPKRKSSKSPKRKATSSKRGKSSPKRGSPKQSKRGKSPKKASPLSSYKASTDEDRKMCLEMGFRMPQWEGSVAALRKQCRAKKIPECKGKEHVSRERLLELLGYDEKSAPAARRPTAKAAKRAAKKTTKGGEKRPSSGYINFGKDVRSELKGLGMSPTEIIREIANRWNDLTAEEKDEYNRPAKKAMEAYKLKYPPVKRTSKKK